MDYVQLAVSFEEKSHRQWMFCVIRNLGSKSHNALVRSLYFPFSVLRNEMQLASNEVTLC
jgi:hypothetical protein